MLQAIVRRKSARVGAAGENPFAVQTELLNRIFLKLREVFERLLIGQIFQIIARHRRERLALAVVAMFENDDDRAEILRVVGDGRRHGFCACVQAVAFSALIINHGRIRSIGRSEAIENRVALFESALDRTR